MLRIKRVAYYDLSHWMGGVGEQGQIVVWRDLPDGDTAQTVHLQDDNAWTRWRITNGAHQTLKSLDDVKAEIRREGWNCA